MKSISTFALLASLLLSSSSAWANPHGASGDGKAWGYNPPRQAYYGRDSQRVYGQPKVGAPIIARNYRPAPIVGANRAIVVRPQRYIYTPAYRIAPRR